MLAHFIHVATVNSALNDLYNNYLKTWAPLLAVIGIAIGGMVWMIGAAVGNSSAGAIGIRVAVICVLAIALIFGATGLVNIGKSLAF